MRWMRKFRKLNELRIDLIKSLGIALLSPMSTIIFMGIIDKSYFSDKLSLVGIFASVFLSLCGLKCIDKVYAVAENTDLANEGASDDGFTD